MMGLDHVTLISICGGVLGSACLLSQTAWPTWPSRLSPTVSFNRTAIRSVAPQG
jgi:hypothetical protein